MSTQQERLAWAMLLKPFAFVLLLGIAYPFKIWVQRAMREGKLKSLLLRRIN
jgi:hypothetical protein